MKKLFLLAIFFGFIQLGFSQYTDPYGETNYDTTNFSDTTIVEVETKKEVKFGEADETGVIRYKPYEKFQAPFDTITELITYLGVVPFKPMPNDVYDGGDIDSLYWRAKIFLLKKFSKDYKPNSKEPKTLIFPKDILIEDYKPDGDVGRIVLRVTMPLMVKQNNFTYVQNGTVTFKIDIRVKDDKYRYKFSNFVHNTTEKQTAAPIKNYAEYYFKNKHNVKGNDAILLGIDKLVKDFVKELANVMKDPVVIDEDNF